MKDPIVDEIRKIRLQIDEEIRINPKKFEDEISSIQERYKDRLQIPRMNYIFTK